MVIGVAREGNAEPCAVLILGEGVRDAKEVVRRANESLAEYQHIRRWFVWPEQDFPRTSTQKPQNQCDSGESSGADGRGDQSPPRTGNAGRL